MAQPYPITRESREEAIFFGDGGTLYGPFALKVFDVADVPVYLKAAVDVTWSPATCAIAKIDPNAAFGTFTVTFPAPVPATTKIKVLSSRVHERSAGVKKGTLLDPDALEKELTKQGTILQELRRDFDTRTLMLDFDAGALAIVAEIPDDRVLMKVGDKLVAGPDIVAEATAARKWAENPEDVAVLPGEFSALHHAQKAAAAQQSATVLAAQAGGYASAAAAAAGLLGAAAYDFSFDSDPSTPGYDWSL